jgi:hypothetical protein
MLHSQICPICNNKEGLGAPQNFKFIEKALSVVSVQKSLRISTVYSVKLF